MMKHYTNKLIATVAMLFCAAIAFAQVTTATIAGSVNNSKGEALIGATVLAVHTPSGSRYGAATNEDGRFTIPNMRVGGPYTITTTYVGHKDDKIEDVILSLAQKLTLKITLAESSASLGELVVNADKNSIMNNQRTGASTTINNEQLSVLPTISRSASDIYRLTPSSDGNSFLGRNGQFNNFSLDGTIFNNPFGLDAATPGGQTDAQPVSLDAIDQIQVSLAPYDVAQAGFTGAAVNAVTKSGTNEFKGTAFGFFRNNNMIGQKVAGTESKVPDLNQGQFGFSLGGPIIKDKFFFFVNAELERRSDLGTNGWVANRGQSGANVSRVSAADFDKVATALRGLGYEPGAYEDFTFATNNNKAIVKLDYNISDKHKLSLTYNWLDAFKEKPAHPFAIGRRGPDFTTMQFENSGYRINNVIHSGIMELKSAISNKISNKLQVGMTAFRDSRDPFSTPFPTININKDGNRYIVAGHEPFSINNVLDQDVLQFNDNLNIYLNKHTLTAGVAFEKFQFNNSFNLGAYNGVFGPGYASVDDFIKATTDGSLKKDIDAAKATFEEKNRAGIGAKGGWALAETNVGQLAAYIQDEFQVTENATVTLGLRMDKPLYFDTKDKILENISTDRNCCYDPSIEYFNPDGQKVKLDHTQLPSSKPLFSPRLGFNIDVKGDKTMQLRGGSGLFTGRFPFVWVGNQVANPNFFFYCTTDPEFKFPQVWRSNFGYDQKFGGGWIASLDVIYTKDINAVMIRNYGAGTPNSKLQGVDNRAIYGANDRAQVFGGPTNAYVFSNTDIGSSFNTTVQLQRNWNKTFYTSLAYNYGVAKDASSISAEISSDAFDRNPAYGNVNQAVLANSLFGNLHRVVGNVWKRFEYGKMATTVSVFFQYVKGGRYSYTYAGDINNDGSFTNDLIFIPTDAQIDQMAFSGTNAAEQRTALKAYIAQDEYLSANRGQVSEKYVTLSPWYNNWDLRLLQDLNINVGGRANTVQLSFDVLNAGNLISSNWGNRQIPSTTQPLGVNVDATGKPTYSFDTNLKSTFISDPSFLSRWQLQVGLRYRF